MPDLPAMPDDDTAGSDLPELPMSSGLGDLPDLPDLPPIDLPDPD
ncbi:MAG: hypothetical protein HKN02_00100, partial [Rhodobacteraceae bacterium]|nr:hypothetical protein [Paracoccaceae bacterium]